MVPRELLRRRALIIGHAEGGMSVADERHIDSHVPFVGPASNWATHPGRDFTNWLSLVLTRPDG
jgi:hypothetical protein